MYNIEKDGIGRVRHKKRGIVGKARERGKNSDLNIVCGEKIMFPVEDITLKEISRARAFDTEGSRLHH